MIDEITEKRVGFSSLMAPASPFRTAAMNCRRFLVGALLDRGRRVGG
jgi:hypothetical protein